MKIRTRFAPSPTGYMHVGNLRTALYTYLTAKHADGTFILRIEDTDRGRLITDSIDVVYKTMRETGLNWDEGPDIGGPVGPYIQSQRMSLYKQYAEQLVKKGAAYYCFCSEERIERIKKEQIAKGAAVGNYDRRCRYLSRSQVEEEIRKGTPYVIRQKMPLDGKTFFDDIIFGRIEVNNAELEDQILLKSDGMPTYNFANVVDDHLMGITHVIRGNEYLSSAPKYNLLYKAFGWDPPIYIHCPPVMKDAHSKLSKRNGDASYQDLINMGFLSEAILNYLLLLGWSPSGEDEIFSLQDMVKIWDPSRISKSPAIFDKAKLKSINSIFIKQLSVQDFKKMAIPWMGDTISKIKDINLLCKNIQTRCDVLSDIPDMISFVDTLPNYSIGLFVNAKQKITLETALSSLKCVLSIFEELDDWTVEKIFSLSKEKASSSGMKVGQLLFPLGVALAGSQKTPGGGTDLAIILGKQESISRIRLAINKLIMAGE